VGTSSPDADADAPPAGSEEGPAARARLEAEIERELKTALIRRGKHEADRSEGPDRGDGRVDVVEKLAIAREWVDGRNCWTGMADLAMDRCAASESAARRAAFVGMTDI
jgi:hypothetical protein